ncbi:MULTISPECIES: DUF4402 domain-containing protein [Marinobacter]|uniref:DUF4402 domain-containing protein n=1 Tax=Marinobacter TaxID=2742 RepID=UPI001245A7BF|nr:MULTISPECIES: DUF4402 domain-containing protein [Marinobacter]MBL3555309.1 DUF4402 domain-containing protein [Marinobacter sp. JB05H06]
MPPYLPKLVAGAVLVIMAVPASWALVMTIQNSQELSFGSFVAGSGGTVTISTSGARSATGGVLLIPSSAGAAAQFTVAGDANATYTIQLPGNDFVKLAGPGVDMTINDFTSSPSGTGGQLDAGGSQTLSIGGTLFISGDQAPGDYSGTFSVTVDYN